MKFKKNGNIKDIKPLDAEEILNSFRNEFEVIQAIKLSPEEALLKAWGVLKKKTSTTSSLVNADNLLEDQIKYQKGSLLSQKKAVKIILTKMRNTTGYVDVSNKWYENYKNAVFSLNVLKSFERQATSYSSICETASSTNPIDFLVTGEIEKIDQGYFVSVVFYSHFLDKVFYKSAFICRRESIAKDVATFIQQNAFKIFKVNYGTIILDTADEECEIYAGTSYMGKQSIMVNYVIPGKYPFSFRTKGSTHYREVVEVFPVEENKILIKPEFHKHLQTVFFNIEPAGTKIFINSQFRGITPFWDSLPEGEYLLSTKTNIYHQDYRYFFKINEINEEQELNFSFHLMTKDLSKDFKLKKSLYYTSFWNFTFSLVTMIPLIIIATDFYQKAALASEYYTNYIKAKTEADASYTAVPFIETEYGGNIYYFSEALRFSAIGISIYTVVSLVWLFYSLFDYINVLEKKDFIPLISFYSNSEEKGVFLGGCLPLGKKRN